MRRRGFLTLAAGSLGVAAGRTRAGGRPAYEPLGSVELPGATEAVMGPDDTTAYVAVTDGVAAVDTSDPEEPRVVFEERSILADREDGPLRGIRDLDADGDRLLVVGPAHGGPALRAAVLYDLADPATPERVAVHGTAFPIHNATLSGGRAYLTGNDGDANPLVILDAGTGAVLGRWSPLDHDARWGEVHPRLRRLHDVWVRGDLAYCCYWEAGTWIVDVSDPGAPTLLGRAGGRPRDDLAAVERERIGEAFLERPGNHHYARTDPAGDLLAVGVEAWNVGGDGPGPGGIHLWDVSDPGAPERRAGIAPPPTRDATRRGVWTTAHNFDLAGGRLYSAWYQGGVRIHDLADPATPVELAWWREPSRTRFWTAVRGAAGVVASTMGTAEAPAGLYVLPDRRGRQPDPPPLTPTATPTRGTPTTTPTATEPPPTAAPRTTDDPDEGSATPRPTTGTAASSPTLDATGSERTRTPVGAPGFGVLAALCGLGLRALRR
ncbi:MAG: LVIVD repeat-containing protein [Halobacteriales archaeon]